MSSQRCPAIASLIITFTSSPLPFSRSQGCSIACTCVQVFDERSPLDDDEKPSDTLGGPFNKLNWMKVIIDSQAVQIYLLPPAASSTSISSKQ